MTTSESLIFAKISHKPVDIKQTPPPLVCSDSEAGAKHIPKLTFLKKTLFFCAAVEITSGCRLKQLKTSFIAGQKEKFLQQRSHPESTNTFEFISLVSLKNT